MNKINNLNPRGTPQVILEIIDFTNTNTNNNKICVAYMTQAHLHN